VKFFCDNNLSPRIACALNCLAEPGHKVVHLRDRFPLDIADVDWLTALAEEEGWAIISGDSSIARNPHEKEAWQQCGHPMFFCKHALLMQRRWEQAARFCHVFPEIIDRAQRARPPDVFQIPVRGKIEGA
jgi:PIN domain-containing protein